MPCFISCFGGCPSANNGLNRLHGDATEALAKLGTVPGLLHAVDCNCSLCSSVGALASWVSGACMTGTHLSRRYQRNISSSGTVAPTPVFIRSRKVCKACAHQGSTATCDRVLAVAAAERIVSSECERAPPADLEYHPRAAVPSPVALYQMPQRMLPARCATLSGEG